MERCIREHLYHSPEAAFALLPSISCSTSRNQLAVLIARCWARQDINAAWNAVSRSPLNATEKQLMFNELWG
jgi:hypothetical protein